MKLIFLHRRTLRGLYITLLLTTAGCTSDNSLSGSLSSAYHLQFDLVRARLYSSELSIEYVSSSSGAIPVRLTLRRKEKEPRADSEYDLLKHGDITGRLPDGTEIYRFTSAKLQLDEYRPDMDARVSGSFDAKFRAGRDTLSLTGTFDTELELVSDPGPDHP